MKTISENVTEQIIEKKSKFICDLIYVNSIEEVEKNLEKINKKYYDAKHHTFAYRLQNKNEILEAYLNIIYVGPNLYGVETGSKYYFNKSAKDLTLEECAFLAGINNSPNSYNPFTDEENSSKITKRTKIVLAKMLELKYINQKEYDEAIANVESGIKFKKGEISSNDAVYSYHTDALITELIQDITKKYNI